MEKFPTFDEPKKWPIIKNIKFLINKWIYLKVYHKGKKVILHDLMVENIEYLQRCNSFSYYLKLKDDTRIFIVDEWLIKDTVSFLTY